MYVGKIIDYLRKYEGKKCYEYVYMGLNGIYLSLSVNIMCSRS